MDYNEIRIKSEQFYDELKKLDDKYWEIAVTVLNSKEENGNSPPISWLVGNLKSILELAMSQTTVINMTAAARNQKGN